MSKSNPVCLGAQTHLLTAKYEDVQLAYWATDRVRELRSYAIMGLHIA